MRTLRLIPKSWGSCLVGVLYSSHRPPVGPTCLMEVAWEHSGRPTPFQLGSYTPVKGLDRTQLQGKAWWMRIRFRVLYAVMGMLW